MQDFANPQKKRPERAAVLAGVSPTVALRGEGPPYYQKASCSTKASKPVPATPR